MPNLPTGEARVEHYPEAHCTAILHPDGTRTLCLSAASLWEALGALARGEAPVGLPTVPAGTDWGRVARELSASADYTPQTRTVRLRTLFPQPEVRRFTPRGRPAGPALNMEGIDL